MFEQAAAEPLDIPVIADGIATGGAFPDPAAWAVLVDAQPAAAMALPQGEGGAMGPKGSDRSHCPAGPDRTTPPR